MQTSSKCGLTRSKNLLFSQPLKIESLKQKQVLKRCQLVVQSKKIAFLKGMTRNSSLSIKYQSLTTYWLLQRAIKPALIKRLLIKILRKMKEMKLTDFRKVQSSILVSIKCTCLSLQRTTRVRKTQIAYHSSKLMLTQKWDKIVLQLYSIHVYESRQKNLSSLCKIQPF